LKEVPKYGGYVLRTKLKKIKIQYLVLAFNVFDPVRIAGRAEFTAMNKQKKKIVDNMIVAKIKDHLTLLQKPSEGKVRQSHSCDAFNKEKS